MCVLYQNLNLYLAWIMCPYLLQLLSFRNMQAAKHLIHWHSLRISWCVHQTIVCTLLAPQSLSHRVDSCIFVSSSNWGLHILLVPGKLNCIKRFICLNGFCWNTLPCCVGLNAIKMHTLAMWAIAITWRPSLSLTIFPNSYPLTLLD